MAIRSLRTSGILNSVNSRSMLVGNIRFVAPLSVEYLVIAGGGSGGQGLGSGGGAGGFRSNVVGQVSGGGASAEPSLTVQALTNYTVTVGAGGPGTVTQNVNGVQGSNSVFSSITSIGGGGGSGTGAGGGNGGSGGGANANLGAAGLGTAGQGFNGFRFTTGGGGFNNGGGGGAGAAATSGAGGSGASSNITGSAVLRGGGGGGYNNSAAGSGGGGRGGTGGNSGNATITSGVANTGGGGGGNHSANAWSGTGGSGVVILRYPNTHTITLGAGLSGSTATVDGNRVTTITAGTGNVSWDY